MDLFIETLTGTAFELRVSPFETIMSVKAKIQRLEGIPISQQHLIWRSTELEDDYCLHDYNITDGTTLQLVLAMRGGPINTRRIPMEDPTLREMAEYMEANRDEIWDKLPKDNRQVTLLVFRDGDQLNFFRVVDRGDGTLTPLSDSLSGASMYNLYDEEEEDQTAPISQEAIKENTVTMNKMQLLQKKMEAVQAQKKTKFQPRPPSGEKPSRSIIPNARRRLHLSNGINHSQNNSSQKETHKGDKEKTLDNSIVTATVGTTSKGPLPPVNVRKNDHIDISDFIQNLEPSKHTTRDSKVNFKQSISRSGRKSVTTDLIDDNNVGRVSHNNSGKKEHDKNSTIHHRSRRERETPSVPRDRDESLGSANLRQAIPSHIRGSAGLRHTYTLDSRIGGITEAAENTTIRRLHTPERQRSGLLNDSLTRSHKISINPLGSQTVTPPSHLPPVKAKPPPLLVPAKKKNRCFSCGKKTGLATTYQCRCGNSFCATHRYAETHKCNYDYKSEGRKLIEQNNPVVTAPKLPKI